LFDGRGCSGVQGLVVVNADGIPIRTTMDHDSSVQARRLSAGSPQALSPTQYAALVSLFTAKVRAVLRQLPLPGVTSDAVRARSFRSCCSDSRSLQNELVQLRIRSLKHEIVVAPDRDYTLVVVHGAPAEEVAPYT